MHEMAFMKLTEGKERSLLSILPYQPIDEANHQKQGQQIYQSKKYAFTIYHA